MYRWHGTGGHVWKIFVARGEMWNPSVDLDSHYQVFFHEFHKRSAWWVAGKDACCLWLLTSPSTWDNVPGLGEGGDKSSPQRQRTMVVYSCRAPKWMTVPVCSWRSGWGGGEATKFCPDGSVLVLQKMLVLHCPECMLLHGARHCSLSPCMTTCASIEILGHLLCGKNCYAKENEHVESKWQNI